MIDLGNIMFVFVIIVCFLIFIRSSIKHAAKEELGFLSNKFDNLNEYIHKTIHDLNDKLAEREGLLKEALDKLGMNDKK